MYVTTFDNHDGYGNPLFVEETGPNFSQRSRTLSYYNDESDWIIGFVDTETISGDGLNGSFSIVNTYHPNWLIKSVNEFGKISGFIYHSTGDLWKSTDPAGNVTEYTNYHRGRARTINQPDIVPNITRVIDNNGNITSITNARNIETTYGFDEMDRLKFINFPSPRPGTSDPTISDVTISLTKTMANTQITGNKTSQGDLTVYEYWDGFGRVVRTKSIATDGTGEALYERYKYDVDGNMTFESQQSNTANPTIGVNYAYDALDRVTRRTEADGSFTKSSYLSDNIQIITDSRDYVTTQQFKSFGSPNEQYLTKSTTAITVYHDNGSTTTQNHVTDIERDAMGFVESITQGGVTHDFEYDERRLLLSETRPETGTTIYTRDNNDNILFKDISGLVVGYTYNGLNWLKNTNFPDGSIVRSYDNNGNLENISYKGVTRSFEFNQVDLVESVTLNITGGPSMTLGYDYNNRRDVNALTYPTGKVIELNPDDFGRTTTVGNYVGSVNYHPSGLLESFSYENGVTTTVTPHPREWVANIKTSNGPSETFVDLAYSYDGEGNTTSLTNAALSPPYSSTTTMSYDELNRLVHVNFPGEEIKNHYLTYDNAGNLLYKSNPREVIDYSYSTSNQLDSATLNWGTGNETVFSYQYTNPYGSVTDDGFSTYTYDDANFLTSVTGYTDIANQFDGDGRKFSMTKDGSTSYYLYSADKLLFEFNETENWLKEYYFLDNNLVAERKVIDLANFDSDNDGISDLSELGVSQ